MIAEIIADVLAGYAAIGGLFAIAFVTGGISRLDPLTKGASVGFRMIIVPGAAALWPLPLTKWIRA